MRIKVCGIRTVADALVAAAAGADAIGLNFVSHSPRCIDPGLAHEIVAALPAGVVAVGVVANWDRACIEGLAARVGLKWVQLHGEEAPGLVPALTGLHVVRALSLDTATGEAGVLEHVDASVRAGRLPDYWLLDSSAPRSGVGPRAAVPWECVRRLVDRLRAPVLLAGGLHPGNVREAIRVAAPAGVDVASGVERSVGVKDGDLVRAFVAAARGGFSPSGTA